MDGRLRDGSNPRRKLVIVDDDRETRQTLSLALEHAGFTVEQVANGLRLFRALRLDRPDAILLDVRMAWIDGFELCRAVKKNEGFRDIPIIILSAPQHADDVRIGLAAGASDCLTKPVDVDQLLARIEALIPQKSRSEGSRSSAAAPPGIPRTPTGTP